MLNFIHLSNVNIIYFHLIELLHQMLLSKETLTQLAFMPVMYVLLINFVLFYVLVVNVKLFCVTSYCFLSRARMTVILRVFLTRHVISTVIFS